MTECLYTIGYRGRTPEEFWKQLRDAGVDILIDVRHNAHWPPNHWSKKALSERAAHDRLYYYHLPQYGIPSEIRRQEDLSRDALLAWYERWMRAILEAPIPRRSGAGTELEPLWGLVRPTGGFRRPCLLCAELDPAECHRSRLALILGGLLNIPIRHL